MSFLARSIPETTFTLRIRDSPCWTGKKKKKKKNKFKKQTFSGSHSHPVCKVKDSSSGQTEI